MNITLGERTHAKLLDQRDEMAKIEERLGKILEDNPNMSQLERTRIGSAILHLSQAWMDLVDFS